MLEYVPNHFKTQDICEMAAEENIWSLVPDQHQTQEICDEAVKEDPWLLKYVPDNFKQEKMKVIKKNPQRLSKKCKAQKAKVKGYQ